MNYRNTIKLAFVFSLLFINAFAQSDSTFIPAYGKSKISFLTKMYSIQDKKNKDSNFALLYDLTKDKKYQEALMKSTELIKSSPGNKMYLNYYITSLYNTGKKTKARSLAKKQIKNQFKKGKYTSGLFYFFEENPSFFVIGVDSVISDYALDLLKSYYIKSNPQKDASLGLMLIDLYYYDQMLRNKMDFKLMHCHSVEYAKKINDWFVVNDKLNAKRVRDLYKQHPNYISEKEVGFPASYQEIIVWHMPKSYIKDTALPRLKKAMLAKEIIPDKYIKMVTRDYLMSGKAKIVHRITDSLCKLYGCKYIYNFYDSIN